MGVGYVGITSSVALFTLAVPGTKEVEDEAYACLCNDDLYRAPGKAANYVNIVAQVLDGLSESLPNIRVVKLRPNYKQVRGVGIASEASVADLSEWLQERTSRN